MLFTVKWSIDIEADSHEQAAVLAHEIATDPKSIATIYKVCLDDREPEWVDVNVVNSRIKH